MPEYVAECYGGADIGRASDAVDGARWLMKPLDHRLTALPFLLPDSPSVDTYIRLLDWRPSLLVSAETSYSRVAHIGRALRRHDA